MASRSSPGDELAYLLSTWIWVVFLLAVLATAAIQGLAAVKL
jgi:hypothetical protein